MGLSEGNGCILQRVKVIGRERERERGNKDLREMKNRERGGGKKSMKAMGGVKQVEQGRERNNMYRERAREMNKGIRRECACVCV